jgi:hypothetical protein
LAHLLKKLKEDKVFTSKQSTANYDKSYIFLKASTILPKKLAEKAGLWRKNKKRTFF